MFGQGGVLQLGNFRRLSGFGWPGFRSTGVFRQDKGQAGPAAKFIEAVDGRGAAPIPVAELMEVARVSIELEEQVR